MLRALACSALVGILLVGGCATTGTSSLRIDPPVAEPPDNVIYVADDVDVVWDRLVRRLSSSFFVINNLERSSGLINLSFSTNQPEEYVDCGTSERTYKRGRDSRLYRYPIAASASYVATGKWGTYNNLPTTGYVERRTQLEGRINIYVAAQDTGTLVTVNCRYVLTVNVDGTQVNENAFGQVVERRPIGPRTSTISFSTSQRGTSTSADGRQSQTVECVRKGRLESEILQMAEPD